MQQLTAAHRRFALLTVGKRALSGPIAQSELPASPDGYAHDLYAALRDMDTVGADVIVVEAPPKDDSWQGVNDRLRRAAFDSAGILDRLIQT